MAIALTAGMRSNLIALQGVDKLMQTTQNRLSTGKRVNSALDDPVNFFKAEDNYNRASDLAAKKDGMGEAIKIIESANTGIEKIEDLLSQMKSLASAAKTSDNVSDLEDQYDKIIGQVLFCLLVHSLSRATSAGNVLTTNRPLSSTIRRPAPAV